MSPERARHVGTSNDQQQNETGRMKREILGSQGKTEHKLFSFCVLYHVQRKAKGKLTKQNQSRSRVDR